MKVYHRLAGVVGNILDHYDAALFALLSPYLAPLFFNFADPFLALIFTYGMIPLGIFSKPLGSLVFGRIADTCGRKKSLFISLCGIGASTAGIGFLPTYDQIGMLAPILLGFLRIAQGFFSAGEGPAGAVYVLEHTNLKNRGFAAGLYDASSIAGTLLASVFITQVADIGEMWRWPFWCGAIAAAGGLWIRAKKGEHPDVLQEELASIWPLIKKQKRIFFSLIAVSGFSYTTYYLAFPFLNGYLPLVCDQTMAEVVQMTPWLLGADFVFLLIFGWIADHWGRMNVMKTAALASACLGIPLFLLIAADFPNLILVLRLGIVLLGAAFSAPFYAEAFENLSPQFRCTLLSLGQSIGSQWIGAPSAVCSLWLYRWSQWEAAPGLYLMAAALLALWGLSSLKEDKMIVPSAEMKV